MKKDEIVIVSIFGAIGVVLAIVAFIVKSTAAKWVLGILAVLVIAFTIYASIDAIVKNKRRPKNLAEAIVKAMKDGANNPDFMQRMEAAGQRRNILFDGQRVNDPDFGYATTNPVMTSTISRSDDYLSRLRTMDGTAFTWDRIGSYCVPNLHGVENVMVDAYQLYVNGKEYKTIYICPYGHSSSYVPQGMKIIEDK